MAIRSQKVDNNFIIYTLPPNWESLFYYIHNPPAVTVLPEIAPS